MPFLTTDDGIRLYYDVHGHGPSELILLHGMGSSSTAWRVVGPEFDRKRFRILTIDFRGHGHSSGAPASFSFPRFHADILAAAAAADVRSATVVGFSGGTKNAIWLAADAPHLVRGVVLVAPPGLGVVPMPREVLWPFFDELTRSKKAPAVLDAWLTEKLGAYRESVVRDYASTPLPVLRSAAEMWFYGSVEDHAARVTQPVLVVAGDREPMGNAEYQRKTTLMSCPHAQLHMLDCGHWIPFEEPVACARSIGAFAERVSDNQTDARGAPPLNTRPPRSSAWDRRNP